MTAPHSPRPSHRCAAVRVAPVRDGARPADRHGGRGVARPAPPDRLDSGAPLAVGALRLADLRTFLAVADERHIGRAAARGYRAQPAVSRQLRRLEDQLGVRLLDRHAHGVDPSAAGRALTPPARRALDALDGAVTAARGQRPGPGVLAPLPELRHILAFIAVGRALSFTAAAGALGVDQSSATRHVRELEARVGVELVSRTSRRIAVTAAGERFLAGAERVLGEIAVAIRAVRRATEGGGRRLVVGHVLGAALELTAPILAELARAHPDLEICLRESAWDDPSAGLRDSSVDVAFVRLPTDVAGDLVLTPLFAEPRIAVVPAAHRFAHGATLRTGELGGQPLVAPRTIDRAWRAFTAEPNGQRASTVAFEAAHLAEAFAATAQIGVLTLAPASTARTMLTPGATFLPVAELEPSVVAAAYRRGLDDPVAADFLAIAARVRAGASELVARIEGPMPPRLSAAAAA